MSKRTNLLKELRNLNETDLKTRLAELRTKLRELAFKTRADEIRDVHQMRKTKKEIAVILTLLKDVSPIKQPSR